ncbi:MAG TPA: recombinase family protein, partial [Nocardioidaceae bacterium]|nr:recombinase family protein [Nocardioidaceae bacterium]
MAGRARAVIYARISMDRTGAGLGVERQREDCERLIRERAWTLVDTQTDNDVSAYSGKVRPGYRALLDSMQSGAVDVVVAWHTDRLHRNPSELEEYIRISEESHTATVTVRAGELDLSTAAGRMVARMLGAAARHESEQKSERVRRQRRQDAEAGRAHGPLGYGYDAYDQIVLAEATVVRKIAESLLRGATLYSIASELNEQSIPTPGAGRWSHSQVSKLLQPEIATDPTGSAAVLKSLPEPVRA